MGLSTRLWAIGLILIRASAAMAAEGPFLAIGLEDARQVAAKEGKRVDVVDFYTTWCAPCKKLDETTWKDRGVLDRLSKEAVALKGDAEKDEALSARYRVNVYPTLLLKPDGTEIDRLGGLTDEQGRDRREGEMLPSGDRA